YPPSGSSTRSSAMSSNPLSTTFVHSSEPSGENLRTTMSRFETRVLSMQPADTASTSTTIARSASLHFRDFVIIAASALLGRCEDRIATVRGLDYSFHLADGTERKWMVPDG